jgi:predicted AlkP superfamily pyrophosphatase or phosphodiesterase
MDPTCWSDGLPGWILPCQVTNPWKSYSRRHSRRCQVRLFCEHFLDVILIREFIRSSWTRRDVGKLVIVVIDALRADFVLSHKDLLRAGVDYGPIEERPKVAYLEDMIEKGEAVCVIAKATPPTVTLPRIKVFMDIKNV